MPDKIVRAIAAKTHTSYMEEIHSDEIENCFKNSKFYDDAYQFQTIKTENRPSMIFLNEDTVSAIFKLRDMDLTILNFASYKHPGGGFIGGSKAQEECLCHKSFLYNVLKKVDDETDYYNWNRNNLNRALYKNRAIYTPNVIFGDNDNEEVSVGVITCACPNKGAAQKYKRVSNEENSEVLASRIEFIKNVAEANNVKTLILGAFGSGVFKQDAREVANLMKEIFNNSSIKEIVYAVLGDNYNSRMFKDIFS